MANSKVGRILALITAIFVILTGILFIVCCAHLYFTGGEQPYSRERVGKYLIAPMIFGIITIGLHIGGLIYAALNNQKIDENSPRTKIELLESFEKRYDIKDFGEETRSIILKKRSLRKTFKIFSYIFSALFFVLIFVYIAFFAEFTTESINADVISALCIVIPLSAIALGIQVVRLYLAEASAGQELELMKAYIKENGAPKKIEVEKKKKFDYTIIATCVIAGVAIVLVVVGIFNGGMSDVLGKAVRICTECIGLG